MRLGIYPFLVLFALHSSNPLANSSIKSLRPRTLAADANCYQRIPGDISDRRYIDKLDLAFEDLGVMTDRAIKNSADFLQSTAFSNYFMENQSQDVLHMIETIFDYVAIPRKSPITYSCGDRPESKCRTFNSPEVTTIALADSLPDHPRMEFCDPFFKDFGSDPTPETTNNLKSKPFNTQSNGWCQDNKDITFFKVAATIVFHVSLDQR